MDKKSTQILDQLKIIDYNKKSHKYKGNKHKYFFTETVYHFTYECSDYMYNRLLKNNEENQMKIVWRTAAITWTMADK